MVIDRIYTCFATTTIELVGCHNLSLSGEIEDTLFGFISPVLCSSEVTVDVENFVWLVAGKD